MVRDINSLRKELSKLPKPDYVHAINALNIMSSGFNIVVKRVAKARVLMYYSKLLKENSDKKTKLKHVKKLLDKV